MSISHKLLFVGDVVLNSKPQFSTEVQHLFHTSIIRCCNVEAPLQGFGKAVNKTGPLVNQDTHAAEWLQQLGFDLFSLANNHIHDYGDEGLLATRNSFPIGSVLGVGEEEDAYRMCVKTVEGIKYGFVAYGENGYGALNGESHIGYAWVNHSRVDKDISRFKAQVDVLVVQVHAGVEMLDVPIPEWRKRFYEIMDQGADILIAHHPHVLQGIEFYNGKPICYSLGNFYFDYPSNHSQWNIGGILEIEIKDAQYYTCNLHVIEKRGSSVVLWDKDSSNTLVERLNSKLLAPAYEQYVDEKVVDLWKKHHTKYYAKAVNGVVDYSIVGILKSIKRIIFSRRIDYSMLWHNLFIESNLWLVKRAVRLLKWKQ